VAKKKNSSGVSDTKAKHVQNLVQKGNWPQVRKLAAEGIQSAVEAINRRKNAAKESTEQKDLEKSKKGKNK
jgi:hypothetical protein